MHRFFIGQKLEEGMTFECPKEIGRQIVTVLRMKPEEMVVFFDGSGYEFKVKIKEIIRKKNCVLEIMSSDIPNREPKRRLTLFQSFIKKSRFEWMLEKGVEVGISEFVPIITERSLKKGFNRERYEKIIKEAAEQSGRVFLPKITKLMSVGEAIEYASMYNNQIFFSSFEHYDSDRVTAYPSRTHVALFIGPEGGWTKDEIEKARRAGSFLISLGKLTLRSETAAVVASYQLLH
ncbi:MAG: hypothetical protein COU46_03660 [Candidatus Niyogibacteria bacterium CG10_big_fil_rev_8_21_14_0_10_42_19]|uniref:Ribosomal RNA small subunit methyltransferase E n=1 Tax=Candidatus Niyogibacteria bacterium CG10_big_fil_rev_8_21_14_0_10_42_19 TaxID=1974725 RepID=A0A2H0TER0_9BACT|nr:MAG: hypothetical protein COU46_03660 [Candidatus Niyogibacteria bacterium CG10_big_fil_rev_8_21_14_0_10_42_19]